MNKEEWVGSTDADARWVMKENLRKKRLLRGDHEWVKRHLKTIIQL
jgi:hypothetical protein